MKPNICRDEDNIWIEWMDKGWRFGIVLDKKKISESSWFMVSRDGKISDGDYLSEEFIDLFKKDII